MTRIARLIGLLFACVAIVTLIVWSNPTGGSAQGRTSITYGTFLRYGGNGPRDMAETRIIDNFKKRYPDIDVKVEIVPWNELHTKFLAAATAGGGPDVVRVDPIYLLLLSKANTLEPLDRYVGNWSQSQKDDFFLWNATVVNGKKMSVNIAQNVFTLLYRKDLFDEKGLKPPTSWADFRNACKALTTPQHWGFAFSAGKTGSYFQIIFAPFIWGAGGEVIDGTGKAVFNSKPGAQAVQYLYDLMQTEKCVPPEVIGFTQDDLLQGYMAGKYAMVIEGANRYGTIQKSDIVRGKVGIAPMPSVDGKKPAPAYSTGGWNLAINRNSKQRDAAWRFIEYYVNPESQAFAATIAGDFPARKSLFKESFMRTPETAHLQQFQSVLSAASRGPILTDRFQELLDSIVLAVQKVFTRSASAQQALEESAKTFNEGLK